MSGRGGVYVHFPYCTHRCTYCDFTLQTPRVVPGRRYADLVLAELALRAEAFAGPAATLYIGGGTPSLWDVGELARVIDGVRARVGLADDAEVTVEANPDQVDDAWIAGVQRAGVNRVSLGVQALHDPLLAALTRRHRVEGALGAVARIARAGLRSWSLDFMFGLPGQTAAAWRRDLERVAGLGAPHLSVYGLSVEPRTLMARDVSRGAVTVPGSDAQADMLLAAREVLCAAGYEHYEISNYAVPGHRAVHNSSYWDWRPYLALGAGAHGFDGAARWQNEGRVKRYEEALLAGRLPELVREVLDVETASFERVMTGLRRLDVGVELGADWPRYAEAVRAEVAAGRLVVEGTRVRLSAAGFRLMDSVLVALMPAGLTAGVGRG
ncbi:MAG: coproporphyrinogen III oxidase [Deltaproteobacteria bacterium HGW-Deltaproteobacteria-14]|jgi:oxygen-independent coproporphyrinogen-3 oxidase|nr:MAG: coproporphyrinogen III oxidase [Deltaproteobacteria bacterium HGW-Deltaproteobacteria-14]